MSNQTKTKLSFLCIELLESFTKKELQKFHQFINSPYFNTDAKLIRLYELIHKEVLHKEFTEELLSKVYMKAFDEKTGKTLNVGEKKVFRTKLSKLSQLGHQFLVIERLDDNNNVFNDLLYIILLEKRQFHAFQLLVKRDKKRLALIKRKEILDFEHLYKIEMHYIDYLFFSDSIYKKTYLKFDNILYALDVQYLIKKLSLLATVFSYELLEPMFAIYNSSFVAIKNLLEIPKRRNQPNIITLCAVIEFLQSPNSSSYQNLLNLLNQNKNQISSYELKGFYLVISNYFIFEMKKGNLGFEKNFTELYFVLDEQNLLLTQNTMPAIKLKNIVFRMCKYNYFDKALYFIEKYIEFVEKEDRISIYKLCLAYVDFYKKDFEKALEHIIEVESVNVIIETNHRKLIMQIYYERDKDYSEKTERLYRSSEKFFSDNKLLTLENKKSYKNFTQILINLYRFKHNEGRMTLEKIHQKLEQQEYNIDKKWLLEKIQELKK